MNEHMKAWMHDWMHELISKLINACVYKCMHDQMNECVNERKDECMNRWTHALKKLVKPTVHFTWGALFVWHRVSAYPNQLHRMLP